MVELEKGSKKFNCPACGSAKKFTRYIDKETGRYIADTVGRCDRETSCGYHLKPKDYFADNPHFQGGNGWKPKNLRKPKNRGILTPGPKRENGLERGYEGRFSTKKPDCIENDHLLNTLSNYDQNAFVQFLLNLFPFDPEDVSQAVNDYLIGTART